MRLDIKQEAQILKTGFFLGYYDKKNIATWADNLILNNNLDSNILDLSFSSSINVEGVITNLNSIINNSTENDFRDEYYLGFYNNYLMENNYHWPQVQRELLRFFSINNENSLDDDRRIFISNLENDLSVRNNGFEGVMLMPDDLLCFLKKYQKYVLISKFLIETGIPSLEEVLWKG